MRTTPWTWLCSGAVAASLAIGTIGCEVGDEAPPSDPEEEYSPAMLDALERDLHLDEEDARARLRAEAEAARLEPALRYQLGDDRYGGAWMNDAGRQLVVAITDPADADLVRGAGAEPVVVDRTLAELVAVKRALDANADTVDDAIHAWYVDVTTNTVVVETSDPDAAAIADFAGASGAVRAVRSTERPQPLYDVRGGDEFILNSRVLCSVGFAVHGGFVTAGHCGGVGTPTAGGNWVAQGTVRGSSFPVHDYAWVETHGGWNTLPFVGDHNGGQVPVAGSAVASVGSSVCRSGRTTGWRCGVIQARDVTINYQAGPVYGATQTSACAEGGDSGGSFISGNQAQGVTSGGSGNCSSGGTTFFQPVNPILDVYGLGLKTSGGGQAIVSHFNDRCIDVPFSNFADGVKLWMWDCNGSSAQRWTFTGGTVRAGDKCMDVAWGATHDGADIQIANCSGHPAQQFVMSSAGDLVSVLANKCVDVRDWNPERGAALQIWSCSGNANQKWSLR